MKQNDTHNESRDRCIHLPCQLTDVYILSQGLNFRCFNCRLLTTRRLYIRIAGKFRAIGDICLNCHAVELYKQVLENL